MQERCPNCFETGYRSGSCGRCGFQESYDKRGARALPAGVVLNRRYYVGRLLGEGGFGITYKAFDLEKESLCAVKEYAPNGMALRGADGRKLVLSRSDVQEPYRAGLRRFLEEAQILSRLERIPAVVDITDSFQENDTAYFVMEFLDGADLRQIVKASRMRLPVEEITNIILQVAMAMDIIHTKTKIIHRDITPDNIYITRDKKVKLIDFGSAKQTVTGAEGGLSVVLKPKFAPPEQFSSKMIQGAYTDVYALAGTYYYALTGRMIPAAPDRLSGTNYVPLKQMNLGIPDGVSDAVDRALALNVNQRTQTMQEFIQGIAGAAKIHSSPPHPRSVYEEQQLAKQREIYMQQLRQEAAYRQQAEAQRQQQLAQQARQAEAMRQRQLAQQAQQAEAMRQRQLAQQAQQAEAMRQRQLAQQAQQAEAMRQRQQAEAMRQRQLAQQGQQAQQAGGAQRLPRPCVQVVAGPEAGKRWEIPAGVIMKAGRSARDVQLVIGKPDDISRVHCQIAWMPDKGKYRVQDVSTYGTFYQGTRLQKNMWYEFAPMVRLMLASPLCVVELGVI